MAYYVHKKWGHAKKTVVGGKVYDSKFEGSTAQELILEKAAGSILGFDTQVNLDMISNGYKICVYRIDFVVYNKDGSINLLESKGFRTQEWTMKWKILESMVETRHPYLIEKFGDVEWRMVVHQQVSNRDHRAYWQIPHAKKIKI